MQEFTAELTVKVRVPTDGYREVVATAPYRLSMRYPVGDLERILRDLLQTYGTGAEITIKDNL